MIDIDPLRARVVGEMHLRPPFALAVPSLLLQQVHLIAPNEREPARVHARSFGSGVVDSPRFRSSVADGVQASWEMHSEAGTATVALPAGSDDGPARAWLAGFPGRIIRAVTMVIAQDDAAAERQLADWRLDPHALVGGRIGEIGFWSDFRFDPQAGRGRIVVAANGADPLDLGRVVQQLQELGNYRNLALMGLPVAQDEGPELAAIENESAGLTERLADRGSEAALLDALIALAGRTARLRAQTAYRMGATRAYGRIVGDRLDSLSPDPLPGLLSLADFTNRRLLPALRTCENFAERLDNAALRIAQATALLRTRLDLSMQEQNRALLEQMAATGARQLRLQHLVEGLSVFAVSYYAVGLFAYLAKGGAALFHAKADAAVAAAVLPIFLGLWWYLDRQKRRH